MKDRNGNKVEYLAVLDTRSTCSLISKELVGKHELKTGRRNSIWDTNGRAFEIRRMAMPK